VRHGDRLDDDIVVVWVGTSTKGRALDAERYHAIYGDYGV